MPKLIDKTTGNIVADKPYDEQGINEAKAIVDTNPNIEMQTYYAGGIVNAPDRSQVMGGEYTGGDRVVPFPDERRRYKKGGYVEKKGKK